MFSQLTLFSNISSWFSPGFLWTSLLVLIGVNMLILVHEWGHFIVARMCGVRCDKFYIWFDAWGFRFFKFKWGDTEFGLGWLPLGGYVKMLGQEDSPGRIKEEIERAKQLPPEGAEGDSEQPRLSPEELAELERAYYSPDSYLAKSVPQRMAIIVAGVAMNVVFAFFCAVGAYFLGVNALECSVGETLPGGVAWQANVRVGDDFTQINNKDVIRFRDLTHAVTLGNRDKGIEFEFNRHGESQPQTIRLTPQKGKKLAPMIGVISPRTLELVPGMPVVLGSPASLAMPEIQGGDTLIAIEGQSVEDYAEYFSYAALHPDEPIHVTMLRKTEVKTEDEKSFDPPKYEEETFDVTLDPRPMRHLGLVMKMGPVQLVQNDSPAAQVGIEPGDVILEVEGQPVGDPMTWPDQMRLLAAERQAAGDETPVSVTLQRGEETITLDEVPLRMPDWYTAPQGPDSPLECAVLGIVYRVEPEIVAVRPGSPAEEAGVAPGSKLLAVKILPHDEETLEKWKAKDTPYAITKKQKPIPLGDKHSWPEILNGLQNLLPTSKIEITFSTPDDDNEQTMELSPVDAKDWNNPDRGLNFNAEQFILQADSLGQAVALGVEETGSSLMMVVKFIEKLTSGQVSAKAMGGPVAIVNVVYSEAKTGMGNLLLILCLLSANLAVLNILPIPVLDGGHMVFLAYEGIFRKPPNESIQIGLSYIGLILLLTLMIWVFSLDLGLISRY